MNSSGVVLLSNASATSGVKQWPGGRGWFGCVGTFGGTSAQLQWKGPNGSSFVDFQAMDALGVFTSVALTANGGFVFELPPGDIKVVLTGGAPSAMYASAARIPA